MAINLFIVLGLITLFCVISIFLFNRYYLLHEKRLFRYYIFNLIIAATLFIWLSSSWFMDRTVEWEEICKVQVLKSNDISIQYIVHKTLFTDTRVVNLNDKFQAMIPEGKSIKVTHYNTVYLGIDYIHLMEKFTVVDDV